MTKRAGDMLTGSIASRVRDERSSTGREEEAWKAEGQEDASVGEEMIESDGSHVQTDLGGLYSIPHGGKATTHVGECHQMCDSRISLGRSPVCRLSSKRICTFDARVCTVCLHVHKVSGGWVPWYKE